MKVFNINDYVNIKLTETGVKILKSRDDNLLRTCVNNPGLLKILGEESNFPEVDENGYTKMPLWKVMDTFGDYMDEGNPNIPFEMDIIISEEYLQDYEKGKSL